MTLKTWAKVAGILAVGGVAGAAYLLWKDHEAKERERWRREWDEINEDVCGDCDGRDGCDCERD